MTAITDIAAAEDLARILDVSRETVAPLDIYSDLLIKWQKAKNLVANATIEDRWIRHFLDSAQLYPLIEASQGLGPHRLLDIGSGAGFPGLVLAAMGLVEAHLVESNGRKGTFMTQVTRATGAKATIHTARIESLEPFSVKLVTSRACASLTQLLDWAAPFCSNDTILYFLKGAGFEQELTQAQASWNMSVQRHPSLSDPSGVIAEIRHLQPRPCSE